MSDPYEVLLFGEALVDQFEERTVVGGAPLNVARHLAGLGLKPLLITRIGRDAVGELIRAEFARFGLSEDALQLDPHLGSGRVRVHATAGGEHRFEILEARAYDAIEAAPALAAARAAAGATLYFGSLAQRAAGSRLSLAQLRREHRGPGFCDLNWRENQLPLAEALPSLRGCSTLKLNETELRLLQQQLCLPSSTARALLGQLGIGQLLVSCGAHGAWSLDSEGRRQEVAAPAQDRLVDTVGAGDAFAAVMLCAQRRGWPLPQALQRATAFASAICGIRGAVPDSLDFYKPWRQAWALRCA
ncbi:fructokinase [Solimonas aquatica]|uniref:Fructokinase n=1 Tax=Solimonas aquatica TaxID=489703 RepID=A0A1H9AQ18_9GAMM|nr:PfkB family carbohydrate kinase [Solimonas aquatica]SEP78902.1 fructokinase [Solimonas aquatica]